jgi:phage-related protein (TIGR01555 family)
MGLGDALEKLWEKTRFDGWVNVLTGMGGQNDKRMAALMRRGRILSDAECSDMYHFDDLAKLICEILPETAMAPGFELIVNDDSELDESEGEAPPDAKKKPKAKPKDARKTQTRNADLETAVAARFQELEVWQKLADAAVWGRCFGGGGLLIGANDGQDVSMPLDLERVKSIDYIVPVDKRSLWIKTWYEDPRHNKFGQPELYRLQRQTPAQFMEQINGGGQSYGAIIHESRIIVFDGVRTADIEKTANRGWGYSVFQAPYDVLRDFGIGWAGASMLLQEASQAVYGVKDLAQTLASVQGEERLRKRFRMIEMGRSIARAMVIDKEETFERKATSFTGLPELLDRFCNRLSAATRIPVTVLMGQAPAGLNATGEADIRTWNATCTNWRKNSLEPAMERLCQLFLIEAAQGKEPENWSIKYPPIYQATPQEQATVEKLVADKDAFYIQWGVLTPEEVATSRYAEEGWSAETQIDLELREQLEEIHSEKLVVEAETELDTAKNPPDPMAMAVGPDGKPVAGPPPKAGPAKPKTDAKESHAELIMRCAEMPPESGAAYLAQELDIPLVEAEVLLGHKE